ncbi:MAG: Splicing factor [Alectoria fallacina]|uniref:U4/U6 snRNA-associated-splicing factor PRP24 n=1 Tax=Alectoria fallacina TaxID=1903189 RepID=A0A8H3ILE1_9LECA|nr:MAG: Splicing factor [Alectoria fallacina]
MDINLLLSPQETPRATPAPPVKPTSAKKARKPRTSKVNQPSPLAHTTLPPSALPHSAVVQAQNAAPTSSAMSASSTSPGDGARTTRQPSTPGMDTLADLASMQHHQQTARANAGGLRSAEIYDHPTSSATILPALQTMSRPTVSSQLRGGSYDMAKTDGPAETPSPRRYSTKALSETDLQTVIQLAEYLAANPFAYDSHVQLIKILHQGLSNHSHVQAPASYDLLQDLQSARETMSSRFALGEDLWADWIQDQILLASSLEDKISVMELCLKGVEEEPGSTNLWLAYGQWMLSLYKQAHPHDQRVSGIGAIPVRHVLSEEDRMMAKEVFSWPQMMEVWKRAEQETRWRINDSHLIWNIWTELLMLELASSPPLQEAIDDTQYHFVNRLQTPHATWDQTFQAYSNFVSRYDDAQYEVTMVTANRLGLDAKQTFSLREIREFEIMRASEKNDKNAELKAYSDYIDWELSQSRKKHSFKFELANAIHQRATLRFPSNSELWEGYAMFLVEEITTHRRRDISALPILDKATRHCPWSGTLWSQFLLSAENSNLAFPDIGDIKHKATSAGLLDAGGLEEVLKVSTAWCGFLRRRTFHQDSTDEDMDVAEVGIRSAIEDMDNMGRTKYGTEYQGDPEYRLEKIYIRYLTQSRNWECARESWKKLIPKKGNSYEFWLRFYLWEMNTWSKLVYIETDPNSGGRPFKPTEATKVLQQALKRPNLDWPEKIIETFQHHCEDNEDAEELQTSVAQVWKARRAVQKRREKEAYTAYEKAQAEAFQQQQQAQQDLASFQDDVQYSSKRKREDAEEEGVSKKSRHDVTESEGPQVEDQHLAASLVLKRDRENATVVVKNLPPGTTETRLRQYFRDCGIINSLKLMPESDGQSATASIEFDSKEDVLTAQTKDMKAFDDRAIEVQIGSGSTLYVCNFPPVADEAWIREKFQEYGEIIDIRFPSLKYDTHRRFCYVQFKSSSDAQSATELDGEDLGDNLKLLARISNPGQKKPREGAIYEGRELYLVNLDRNTTRADIKQAFKKYGYVESVRVLTKVDGQSKGIAYVVFRSKDEAEAALEMNLTNLGNRILNVSISTNDKSKRKQNRIVTSTSTSQRGTASPAPNMNDDTHSAASPAPSTNSAGQSKFSEIQSRTLALLNIPDTVNDARIRALTEPYGELVKVSLRPNHQGAIIEYKNEASVGKASLALEGHEIASERQIRVGTFSDMNQQKAEYRSDRIPVGAAAKTTNAQLQGPAPIRRPGQPGTRRGGKGGLGIKRGGVGLSGSRAMTDGEGKDAETKGTGEGEETGKAKSNADFKALFLKNEGT